MTKTVRLMVVALVSSVVGLVREQVWAFLSESKALRLLQLLALDRSWNGLLITSSISRGHRP
jgi:hypothetical protein